MVGLYHRGPLLLLACATVAGCAGGSAPTGPADYGAPVAQPTTEVPIDPPPTTGPAPVLGPRIRRLTNAEYDATVQALLGTEQELGASFVPDARLYKYGKFDRNEAQIVEPTLAHQLQQAAASLADEYVTDKLDQELPCAAQGDATCARTFFEGFLPKAYRRPVEAAELDDLMRLVVDPSVTRDGFRAAIALGIEATLQSPAFLYHTELGEAPSETGIVTMTHAEIAEAIAYLVTGAPADSELSQASDLETAAGREAQVRRLLATPEARPQLGRMVEQWLQIDQAGDLIKDEIQFPDFRPHLLDDESGAFLDEALFTRDGSFQTLMNADFTVGTSELADFYGAPPPSSEPGLIDLSSTPRRGIVNLGAFLISHETPIRRGARFLTQVLCINPGDPATLGLQISLPPPSPTKTRRQRFEEHNQSECAVCHDMIDSVGFSFEHFDEMGRWLSNEDDDPDLPIDSATTLVLPADIPFGSQTVVDSAELAELTSESEAGSRCFARNLARFVTAAYGAVLEQGFLDEWKTLTEAGDDRIQELLVAYVRSSLFVERDPSLGVDEP